MVQKLSRLSRNFLVWLETFQIGCKPSRLVLNLPDCQETFQTVHEFSRLLLCFDLILSRLCRYAQKLSSRQCRCADRFFGIFLVQTSGTSPPPQKVTKIIWHIEQGYIALKLKRKVAMYFSPSPAASALHFHVVVNILIIFAKYSIREAIRKKKVIFLWTFSVRGGGLTNFTEAIFE